VHVPEAPYPRELAISVTSLFPSREVIRVGILAMAKAASPER
jgi:hypothetical protein